MKKSQTLKKILIGLSIFIIAHTLFVMLFVYLRSKYDIALYGILSACLIVAIGIFSAILGYKKRVKKASAKTINKIIRVKTALYIMCLVAIYLHITKEVLK